MTNVFKRRRGRPQGSGKDDMPILKLVADTMAANPGLTKTEAIKEVLAHTQHRDMEATIIRRLQGKWVTVGTSLLVEAQQRADNEAADQVQTQTGSGLTEILSVLGMIGIFQQRFQEVLKPYHPVISELARTLGAFQNRRSAAIQAIALANSEKWRPILEAAEKYKHLQDTAERFGFARR